MSSVPNAIMLCMCVCLLGDVLSQCYFDLVGRCGYHADLQESSDLLFLAEDGNEPIVAAKSAASQSLSEEEKPQAPASRSISFLPKVNDRRRTTRSRSVRAQEERELPSGIMEVAMANEPIDIRLTDVLGEIRLTRSENARLDLVSVEAIWHASSAVKKASIRGLSSKTTVMDGKIVTRWRLVRQSSVVKVYPNVEFSNETSFVLVIQVRAARKVVQYSKEYFVEVDPQLDFQPMDQPERFLVESSAEEDAATILRRLNTGDSTSQDAVTLELLPVVVDLEEGTPLRLSMSELFQVTRLQALQPAKQPLWFSTWTTSLAP